MHCLTVSVNEKNEFEFEKYLSEDRPDENAEVVEQRTRTEQSTETFSEPLEVSDARRGQTLGWRRRVPTAEWTHLGCPLSCACPVAPTDK